MEGRAAPIRDSLALERPALTPLPERPLEVGALRSTLDLAAASGSYSADAVRQLLCWADAPPPRTAPLDPQAYLVYPQAQPRPNLGRYNQLLQAPQEGPAGTRPPSRPTRRRP